MDESQSIAYCFRVRIHTAQPRIISNSQGPYENIQNGVACQCFAARVPVQSGKSECSVHQRRNPADGAPGETQCHCHQSDEGADGRSQNAAA